MQHGRKEFNEGVACISIMTTNVQCNMCYILNWIPDALRRKQSPRLLNYCCDVTMLYATSWMHTFLLLHTYTTCQVKPLQINVYMRIRMYYVMKHYVSFNYLLALRRNDLSRDSRFPVWFHFKMHPFTARFTLTLLLVLHLSNIYIYIYRQ